MKIIKSIKYLKRIVKESKRNGSSINFIPTMGALHLGHIKLIQKARKRNAVRIVSIFINPSQFGPSEDFKNYPCKCGAKNCCGFIVREGSRWRIKKKIKNK